MFIKCGPECINNYINVFKIFKHIMQFDIQTGGKGSRVEKITRGKPKCLLNVGKKKI